MSGKKFSFSKKLATFSVAVMLMGSSVFAGNITKINLNGNKLYMNISPVSKEGAIYLSIRSFEQFGFNVAWDQASQTVTLKDNKHTVTQKVGDSFATADGNQVDLGAAAYKDSKGNVLVPVRFISKALGGTAIQDKATNTINVTYEVNVDKVDAFGRPIKTTGTLPKRMAKYTYYTMGIPTEMFDQSFGYERMVYSPGIVVAEGKQYVNPINMSKYRETYFTLENQKTWMEAGALHLDNLLNVDYKTVNNEWVQAMTSSMTVDDEYYGPIFTREANEYINYLKTNKISVQGDYYIEPNICYDDMGIKMRAYVRFKISSPTAKKANLFYVEFTEYNTGVWYSGYIDFKVGSNIQSDGSTYRLQTGSRMGQDFILTAEK